jgi:hypothetical protein
MEISGGIVTHTIEIVVERDDKTGEIFVKGNYKDLPIDMLYEATKFVVGQMLASSEHVNDPLTRKTMFEVLRGCQYLIKGGEAALMETRARMAKQG